MSEAEKVREVVARALCKERGENPNLEYEYLTTHRGVYITRPLWTEWLPEADAAIAAIEAAGLQIVPKIGRE